MTSETVGEKGIATLVTGGTGFIGSEIVRKLVEERETVHVLTRDPQKVPRSRRVPGAFYIKGDIFDPVSLEKAMEGCWAVINATQFDHAPFENRRKGLTYEKVDGEGTERQVEAAKKQGVKRFIYLSGAGTREGRSEPWFRAKFRAEKAVQSSGMDWTIFRPSWVFGPQDRSLNQFAMFGRFLPFIPLIGMGNGKVQPLFVEDLATIIWKSLSKPTMQGRIYDVGGPQELSMKEIVRTMLRVQGKHRIILPQPKILMKVVATFAQFLPGPPLTPGGVDFVTMEEKVDNASLLSVLPMNLVSLKSGLQTYLGNSEPDQIEKQRVAA